MARGIWQLFEREDLKNNLMTHRFQVHAAALANARGSKDELSRLELRARRRLRVIRVWTINQWREALCEQEKVSHTSDEESDDSNGDLPWRQRVTRKMITIKLKWKRLAHLLPWESLRK